MTALTLPYRATTAEACAWLAEQLGDAWSLARLLEHGITPYVWLDYDPAYPDLFGDANGGYAAPIFFEGDTARLAQGSPDVHITRTKDVHKIVTTLPAPGFTRELAALRFMKKDLEKLSTAVRKAREPAKPAVATESRDGLCQQEIMAVFAPLLRIDLAAALAAGGGVFGDEGARVKGSAARGKNKAIWNPVTLALGLNDAHRVPIGQLKRAFATHEVLQPWAAQWNQSLALLGK